jgi:parallel beta-helix repeat protein
VNHRVTDSGVHGIILATRVRNSRVENNVVEGSRLHGIVVFDGSRGNVVQHNTVLRTLDGIVVTDSSGNRIADNTVRDIRRFGLRISGLSNANVIESNLFERALLGVYAYKGASGNSFLANRFVGDRENLRIRSDTRGNRVSPIPPRSEVAR